VSENSPADYVALVVDHVRASRRGPEAQATAELLEGIVWSWDRQPLSVRTQAVAVARALHDVR
jgi:hypothetical protein